MRKYKYPIPAKQPPQQHPPLSPFAERNKLDDKIYCIYVASTEDLVREHAKQGGFPANRVSRVRTMINPTTSE